MPSWQGKSRGSALGYRIFVGILRKGGVKPAYFLLRFVSLYYVLFSYNSSKHIYHFFHEKLGFGALHSLSKLYQNYYQFGQSLIDKVVIQAGLPNHFSFTFEGEESLRQMVQHGKGGLLLSAHIGNWEIAGHLLERLDAEVHIVMYDGEHQKIKEYLDSMTDRPKAQIILIKDDLSHIFQIDAALKRNALVCMHADRFIEGNKTLTTSFFSRNATFPAGPFLLAAKYKVPVSFVFALKEGNLHYHFYASSARQYIEQEKAETMRLILAEFARAMESKLKKYPEQWFNYYDFWQA